MSFSYLPHTEADRRDMLAAIGAQTVAELFKDIPEDIRLVREMALPEIFDEAGLLQHLRKIAVKNADFCEYSYFIGAGAYDHYVPAVIDALISRSEFTTAYTQYQPELAQGYLQALWEYQSMICILTGMDVCNASLYDGGTALAEAMMVAATHTKRKQVIATKTLHPHYRTLLSTYAIDLDINIADCEYKDGVVNLAALEAQVNKETAAIIIQSPNFFGLLEDLQAIAEIAHKNGALLIVSSDPISLAMLKPPGELGADIVVGEGQALGIAASFGGPGLGFFCATEKIMRKMPGRIVGQTVDSEGKRGFVLTLQAREQHIRREKATSNICSNQALCALSAAIYMSVTGKNGLPQIANLCLQKAHYAYEKITALSGYEEVFSGPFFKEFVVKMPKSIKNINDRLLEHKIVGGLDLGRYYPEMTNCMLICVTENRSKEEIDAFVKVLEGLK